MRRRTVVTAALCVMFVVRSSVAQTTTDDAPSGTIHGTVADTSGSVVVAAIVTLQFAGSSAQRTTITDQTGSFHFSAVELGTYALTIRAGGFADLTSKVSVVSGENPPLPAAVLQVAPAITRVDVGLSQHELAVEQMHAEETQRLLGVFPNFLVSYQPNAAPLTAAQKFQLGWKTIIDPVVLLGSGITAGIEQARNNLPGIRSGHGGVRQTFWR